MLTDEQELGADDDVIEMALCEAALVYLRANQTYRFVILDNCSRCQDLDDLARGSAPSPLSLIEPSQENQ